MTFFKYFTCPSTPFELLPSTIKSIHNDNRIDNPCAIFLDDLDFQLICPFVTALSKKLKEKRKWT